MNFNYVLSKDFNEAYEFLNSCNKTDGNWKVEKLSKYDYVVYVKNDINEVVNVSFIELYDNYVRIAIAYYTHNLKIRNLMWIDSGIAEHCIHWFKDYKGLFVSYHEKDLKLYMLCKYKLKNGSGKFASPENIYFQKFKILKDKKIFFKWCWQYIAYYDLNDGNYNELLDLLHKEPKRENLLVTFANDFTEHHGAFNLNIIKKICKKINFKLCVISHNHKLNDNDIDYFIPMPKGASLKLSNEMPNNSTITFHFVDYINKNKIAVNNLMFYLEWHMWDNLKPFRDVATQIISFHRIIGASLVEYSNDVESSDMLLYLENQMINDSDLILCGSEGIKKDIIRHYGQRNIKVIPTYSSFLPRLVNVQRDINLNSKDLITVGRVDYQKGFHRIKTNNYNIKHVTPKIQIWSGTQENNFNYHWYNLVGDSAFILLPAIYETRGLIVQEAMALGLIPIVQNNQFGLAEQINHGINGFLVDYDMYIDDIILKIRKEFTDKDLYHISKTNKEIASKMKFLDSFNNFI